MEKALDEHPSKENLIVAPEQATMYGGAILTLLERADESGRESPMPINE